MKRKRKIGGQYVTHLRALIESPAWRVLSLSALRLLARIEIEHMRHGGQENGKLAVTYDDFIKYGINRHAIAPAIRECIALGVLLVTRPGRGGNAEFRAPNLFLLPYMETDTAAQKWRQIATIQEAEAVARTAARRSGKKQNPGVGFRQAPVSETNTENRIFSVGNQHRKKQIPSVGNQHYFLDASHCSATGNDSSGNSDAVQQPERGTDLTDEDFIPEFLTRRHSG
jgi:hypothetical protein